MRLLTVMALLMATLVPAGAYNPFELRHRMSPEELHRMAYSDRNPFELIRGEEAVAIRAFFPGAPAPNAVVRPTLDKRYLKAPGLLFWVYLGLLGLLTLLVNLGRSPIGRMFRASLNEQLALSLQRDLERSGRAELVLWTGFFFINGGIFLFQAANWYTRASWPGERPMFIVWLSLGLLGYYALKHLALAITGWIFPLQKPFGQYRFSMDLYNALLGLALFPINAGISYAEGWPRDAILFLGFALVAASFLQRWVRGLSISLPYLTGSPIHFFLYLCTVEMAPVLVLVRWSGMGMMGS